MKVFIFFATFVLSIKATKPKPLVSKIVPQVKNGKKVFEEEHKDALIIRSARPLRIYRPTHFRNKDKRKHDESDLSERISQEGEIEKTSCLFFKSL